MRNASPSVYPGKRGKCIQLFTEAINLHRAGMSEMAMQVCRQILTIDQNFEDAYTMQGNLFAEQGKFSESIDCFRRAIQINPKNLSVHVNMGLALLNESHLDEAEIEFQKILSINSGYVPAINGLGVVMVRKGNLTDAIRLFQLSLIKEPAQPDTLNNLGSCFLELGEIESAEKEYKRAIQLLPNHLDALFNYAKLCAQTGRVHEAMQIYAHLISVNPNHAPAVINLSKILIDEARTREAIDLLSEAVKYNSYDPEVWYAFGVALKERNEFTSAIEVFSKVIELNPKHHAAFVNRGASLREINEFSAAIRDLETAKNSQEADTLATLWATYAALYEDTHQDSLVEEAFQKSIQFNPNDVNSQMNYGVWLLKEGRFKEAWLFYQNRHKIKASMTVHWLHSIPVWTEGNIQGEILLISEQGVGDQIFHIKFLKVFLERYGKPACVLLDQRLISIYKRTFPDISFLPLSQGSEINPSSFDMQLGMADLATLLCLDPVEEKIIQQPSIYPELIRSPILNHLRGKPIIGLSWKSANAKSSADKSICLIDLMRAFKNIDAHWINLQYGDVDEDIINVKKELGIDIRQIHEVDVFNDLDGLTQLIHECDMVISISNSTAHFAGALGKSGLVLVPFNKGKLWYWHKDDGASVWYPSLRVVHCKAHGDWSFPLSTAYDYVKKQLDNRIL